MTTDTTSPATYPAVGFATFGGTEVLEVVTSSMSPPGPDEVTVEVIASTVNPTDLLMRSGAQAATMTALVPPYVAGVEFFGRVHAVGADVDDLAAGQPVMGVVNARRPSGGGHARYVTVPAATVSSHVHGLDPVEAATLPMNGLTATLAVDALALEPGSAVLVTGGPGALGGYAIQLAKEAGLVVVADAHAFDTALLHELGADHVVPRGPGMAAAVRGIVDGGVSGAIDAARLGDATASAVRDGGSMIVVRASDASDDDRIVRRPVNFTQLIGDRPALDRLGDLALAGRLTPRVAHRVPFAEAARAHSLVEAGRLRGRVVLTFE